MLLFVTFGQLNNTRSFFDKVEKIKTLMLFGVHGDDGGVTLKIGRPIISGGNGDADVLYRVR